MRCGARRIPRRPWDEVSWISGPSPGQKAQVTLDPELRRRNPPVHQFLHLSRRLAIQGLSGQLPAGFEAQATDTFSGGWYAARGHAELIESQPDEDGNGGGLTGHFPANAGPASVRLRRSHRQSHQLGMGGGIAHASLPEERIRLLRLW